MLNRPGNLGGSKKPGAVQLVSTLWDDDWTCVGGSEQLIAELLSHPALQGHARRVIADEDATPPGHQAF